MTFTMMCVGIVIIIGVLVLSALPSLIMEDEWLNSWILSAIACGVLLTIVLYQNGIIKCEV